MAEQSSVRMDDIDDASQIIGALDSPLRMEILLLLAQRDHVVHELVTTLNKSQPLISQHLRVLRRVGLVESQRAGREVMYSLAVPEVIDSISGAAEMNRSLPLVDELAQRRQRKLRDETNPYESGLPPAMGSASITGIPVDTEIPVDPGLAPRTPRPKK